MQFSIFLSCFYFTPGMLSSNPWNNVFFPFVYTPCICRQVILGCWWQNFSLVMSKHLGAWWGCRRLSVYKFISFAVEKVASMFSLLQENQSSASNDYPASGVTALSHAWLAHCVSGCMQVCAFMTPPAWFIACDGAWCTAGPRAVLRKGVEQSHPPLSHMCVRLKVSGQRSCY